MSDYIDLRDPGGGSDPARTTTDGAIELIARALAGVPAEPAQGESGSPDHEMASAAEVVDHGTTGDHPHDADAGAEAPDPHPAAAVVGLTGLDGLPRRIRRRLDLQLAEGEEVECAILPADEGGPTCLVATTHRIIVVEDAPGRGGPVAAHLPYHRTTATRSAEGVVRLSLSEFGTATEVHLHPDRGFETEVAHLFERTNSA